MEKVVERRQRRMIKNRELAARSRGRKQIEGLFSRPLSKDQMEAIMELANQGKGKKGSKLRGCKVAPLKAPIIKAASGI